MSDSNHNLTSSYSLLLSLLKFFACLALHFFQLFNKFSLIVKCFIDRVMFILPATSYLSILYHLLLAFVPLCMYHLPQEQASSWANRMTTCRVFMSFVLWTQEAIAVTMNCCSHCDIERVVQTETSSRGLGSSKQWAAALSWSDVIPHLSIASSPLPYSIVTEVSRPRTILYLGYCLQEDRNKIWLLMCQTSSQDNEKVFQCNIFFLQSVNKSYFSNWEHKYLIKWLVK